MASRASMQRLRMALFERDAFRIIFL
jgi:hypothetical protein